MSSRSRLPIPVALVLLVVALGGARPASAAAATERHDPRLLVVAPSEVVAGEAASFAVVVQDEWGREGPPEPRGAVWSARFHVTATDSLAEVDPRLLLEPEDRGFRRARVVFRTPGLHRITVGGEPDLGGRSNPILVREVPPAERVYWGDLHGHLHTPGAGHTGPIDLDEYARHLAEGLAWARDGALLDFAAFTEHLQTAGGLARTDPDGRSPWGLTLQAVEAAHVPGEFVVFPGFEWQGDEGDHCVIWPAPGPLGAPAGYRALIDEVRSRRALLTAHAVFLPDTFDDAPPELAAIEVTRDSKSTEWLGANAIAKGVIRPFLGCSDTHGGALGAMSLTGIRAPALTRDEVFRAIRAGRCWATNGERIVVDFSVDTRGEVPRVSVRGTGTAPIDRVEIWRDGRLVADERGLPPREEFEFVWEDDDLLRAEALAGEVAYHARIIQVSASRYDPAERDLAISSPAYILPAARHLDAAHARRGGRAGAGAGAALEGVREAWRRLAAAPGRPLRADPLPGAALPAWNVEDLAALDAAVVRFASLADHDTSLAELARTLELLPEIAAAVDRLARSEARVRDALARSAPTPARVDALRAEIDEVRTLAAAAEARVRSPRGESVAAAWFAPRVLGEAPERLHRLVETFSRLPEHPAPVVRDGSPPVDRVIVPVDPRTAAAVGAVERRVVERHALHEDAWGYTSPSPAPGVGEAALRVRMVAEGDVASARLSGGGIDPGDPVPLRPDREGWTAVLDRVQVPVAGEAPLELAVDPPVRGVSVFLEAPGGAPLRAPGRVTRLAIVPRQETGRVAVDVELAPVDAELVTSAAASTRVLWSGTIDVGAHTLPFPVEELTTPEDLRLRWGFGGWRRVAAVEVPGHDVARPLGFGALADGRGAIALEDALVLVDPDRGTTQRLPYPEGVRLERGRTFCAAPGASGTVFRGASGPGGGWVVRWSPDGGWSEVAPGPEAGTLAADGSGGLAWLVDTRLYRRDAGGRESGPWLLEAGGRLIAMDPAGRPLVGVASGHVVREDPATGRILETVPGPVIGVDGSGAVLRAARLDRRHPELATGVVVARHASGESGEDGWTMITKPLPTGNSPLLVAAAPDGSLLVVGGTIGWRRGPGNDWWGATVERWQPVWAGEARAH